MTAVVDAPVLLGRTVPRLATPPLASGPEGPCGCGCALSPDTSLGFEAIEFAEDVLAVRLYPWQRWWLIHALELSAKDRFRFRTVITLVARQNGKTQLAKMLVLWAMYMERAHLVLGSAQDLKIAREAWQGAVDLSSSVPDLSRELGSVRYANGEQCLTLITGARYMITAATRSAGRGLSVDLLLLDELREQRDWDAWGALSKTTIARPNSLIVGITNQGDDQSVVLNSLRSAALAGTDPQLGLFEWSAPDNVAVDDPAGWAQANPALGRGDLTEAAIRMACTTDPPTTFRTEVLCQKVDQLDAAVDPFGWPACSQPGATVAAYAKQAVLCVDVAYDDHHVTLAAAAPDPDGRVWVEIIEAWASTADARTGTVDKPSLAAIFEVMRPRAVGWFPGGPGAVLGVDLQPFHGVTIGRKLFAMVSDEMAPEAPGVVELNGGDAVRACQGLADLVDSRALAHPDDALLNAHISASTRKDQGDGWRFARRDSGRNDAAYAVAGAAYLARSLPPVEDYNVLDSIF